MPITTELCTTTPLTTDTRLEVASKEIPIANNGMVWKSVELPMTISLTFGVVRATIWLISAGNRQNGMGVVLTAFKFLLQRSPTTLNGEIPPTPGPRNTVGLVSTSKMDHAHLTGVKLLATVSTARLKPSGSRCHDPLTNTKLKQLNRLTFLFHFLSLLLTFI